MSLVIFDRILLLDHTVHWTAWAIFGIMLLIFCSPTEYLLKELFRYSRDMGNALKNTVSFGEARKLFANNDYSALNPVDKMRRNILIFKHDEIFEMQKGLEALNQKLMQAHTEWAQQFHRGQTNPWMGSNSDDQEYNAIPIAKSNGEIYSNAFAEQGNQAFESPRNHNSGTVDRNFMESDSDFRGPASDSVGLGKPTIPEVYRDTGHIDQLRLRQPISVQEAYTIPNRLPGTQIVVPAPLPPPGRGSRPQSPGYEQRRF